MAIASQSHRFSLTGNLNYFIQQTNCCSIVFSSKLVSLLSDCWQIFSIGILNFVSLYFNTEVSARNTHTIALNSFQQNRCARNNLKKMQFYFDFETVVLKSFQTVQSLCSSPHVTLCSFKYDINQWNKSVSIVIFMKNKLNALDYKKTLLQKFLIGHDNCKRLHKFPNNHNGALSFEYVFKFLFCFRGAKRKLVECKIWWGFWKNEKKKKTLNSRSPVHKKPSVKQKSLIDLK